MISEAVLCAQVREPGVNQANAQCAITCDMQSHLRDIASMRIGLLVNRASGTATAATAQEVHDHLQLMGALVVRVWDVEGKELPAALTEAQSAGLDTLIVFGGDGTIRSAAKGASMGGPVLIPLPGGTMNLLPKALYGNRSWKDILAGTLAQPQVRCVSGGSVNGEHFFISAIIGAPALFAHVREAVRDGELAEAVVKGKEALGGMFADKVSYSFNEMHEGSAEALIVTCPLVSDALASERQALEAAVIDVQHAGEVLDIATAAALGQWRDSQKVSVVASKQVQVTSSRSIPLILDGETVNAASELAVAFVPAAFRVLVPGPRASYFLDFDRTIFDTPAFKKSVEKRPTLAEVLRQIPGVAAELFKPHEDSRLRRFRRMLGTFASHGRFSLTPTDLKKFLYPEVEAFFATHDCTIVTYGVESFIRAKVTGALTDLRVSGVVYTSQKKGKTIRKLSAAKDGPCVFIDDAHFQLESVAKHCPKVAVIEMRRDAQPGDGRWPVITSLNELSEHHLPTA